MYMMLILSLCVFRYLQQCVCMYMCVCVYVVEKHSKQGVQINGHGFEHKYMGYTVLVALSHSHSHSLTHTLSLILSLSLSRSLSVSISLASLSFPVSVYVCVYVTFLRLRLFSYYLSTCASIYPGPINLILTHLILSLHPAICLSIHKTDGSYLCCSNGLRGVTAIAALMAQQFLWHRLTATWPVEA